MTEAHRLIYLPLGGAGEIGMNCYVYGYGTPGAETLIVVDLGVTFPDMDGTPGVDLIMADVSWLEERADRIAGIFITHAHEDHIGALGHLWGRLKAPVYARRFTAIHARRKLNERGHPADVVQEIGSFGDVVEAGPFQVQFAPVSHSIPEASAMIIDTPEGRIVHSGDFKLDTDPMVGEPFDRAFWEDIGAGGVLAFVCDSTNVFSQHPGRSEALLPEPITALVAGAKGMVAATTFASNIARVKTLADAAVAAGRSVCLMGRSMHRMISAGVEAGVLTDFPRILKPEEALDVPRENLMLIVTGSQGERRAASAALARGKYLGHTLEEGDMFLFSSKTIPGNENAVARVKNTLAEAGVIVIDDDQGFYHVSGHANRPDLTVMHNLLKPAILVPHHGEYRHLTEHARLAAENGLSSIVVENGSTAVLAREGAEIVENMELSRVYLDGDRFIGALDGVVRERIKLALNGLVCVGVVVEDDDLPLPDTWIATRGLAERASNGPSLEEILENDLAGVLNSIDPAVAGDDDDLEETVRRVVRRSCERELGKKPEVVVLVTRLMAE